MAMLKHFGSTPKSVDFYAEKYRKAFPLLCNHLIDLSFLSKEKQFTYYYSSRLFERFFEWFGLVKKTGHTGPFSMDKIYVKTDLIDNLFDIPELLIV